MSQCHVMLLPGSPQRKRCSLQRQLCVHHSITITEVVRQSCTPTRSRSRGMCPSGSFLSYSFFYLILYPHLTFMPCFLCFFVYSKWGGVDVHFLLCKTISFIECKCLKITTKFSFIFAHQVYPCVQIPIKYGTNSPILCMATGPRMGQFGEKREALCVLLLIQHLYRCLLRI